ncbi:MAG: hypothetical protein ACYCXK_11845 [Candidatus Humimicrobiaceae bacterium]
MDYKQNSLKAIGDEVIRQFDLLLKIQDSHDAKIGIILGFIILILVQIFLRIGSMKLCFNSLYQSINSIFNIIGFILILYSGIAGLIAYFSRSYNIGPNIDDLIREYEKKSVKDFEKIIYGTINKSYKNNLLVSKRKSSFMNQMMIFFYIGFILIIIPNILRGLIF